MVYGLQKYGEEQFMTAAEIDDKMDAAKEQFSKNPELKQHIIELTEMTEDLAQ